MKAEVRERENETEKEASRMYEGQRAIWRSITYHDDIDFTNLTHTLTAHYTRGVLKHS